jgi:hypothetical protein
MRVIRVVLIGTLLSAGACAFAAGHPAWRTRGGGPRTNGLAN